MSGLLCLKWNNHSSSLLKKLNVIYSKEVYCDATIACQGKYYPVHRLVLSTCSDYFEEIFERIQCRHPFIIVKDIAPLELEALLNYMYNGEVNVLQETLPGLIKAAEALKIKGLAVPDESPFEEQDFTKENKKRSDTSSPSLPLKRSRRQSGEANDDTASTYNKSLSPETTSSNQFDESASLSKSSCSIESPKLENGETSQIGLHDIKVEALDFNEGVGQNVDDDYESVSNPASFPTGDTATIYESDFKNAVDTPSVTQRKENQIFKSEIDVAQCSTWDNNVSNNSNAATVQGEISGAEEPQKLQTESEELYPSLFDSSTFPLQTVLVTESQLPSKGQILGKVLAGECPHCSYKTNKKCHLKVHIQRKHTSGQPFACSSCDYKCSSLETLKIHNHKHSKTYERYKCNVCPYETLYSTDIKRHKMSHTGEKPFGCDLCNFRTIKKSHLKYHINKCHDPTWQ